MSRRAYLVCLNSRWHPSEVVRLVVLGDFEGRVGTVLGVGNGDAAGERDPLLRLLDCPEFHLPL